MILCVLIISELKAIQQYALHNDHFERDYYKLEKSNKILQADYTILSKKLIHNMAEYDKKINETLRISENVSKFIRYN